MGWTRRAVARTERVRIVASVFAAAIVAAAGCRGADADAREAPTAGLEARHADAATRRLLWDVSVGDNQQGYHITAAPVAVDGKVITGISRGEQLVPTPAAATGTASAVPRPAERVLRARATRGTGAPAAVGADATAASRMKTSRVPIERVTGGSR